MPALSLRTSRLQIRWLDLDDAEFVYNLVNDPDWLRFIGDKSVRNLDDARAYLENGPLRMYRDFGFGLNRVALRDSDEAIGLCGILQRDNLPCPDLGFALLKQYRRQGYALEAAASVLEHAAGELGHERLCAIVTAENRASASLLKRLGFHYDSCTRDETDASELDFYLLELKKPPPPQAD